MRTLEDLEATLLQPSLLPERWLRRNVVQYEVVTYVHHALTLARSGRADDARVFAKRAHTWLHENTDVELGNYRGAVVELCTLLLDQPGS